MLSRFKVNFMELQKQKLTVKHLTVGYLNTSSKKVSLFPRAKCRRLTFRKVNNTQWHAFTLIYKTWGWPIVMERTNISSHPLRTQSLQDSPTTVMRSDFQSVSKESWQGAHGPYKPWQRPWVPRETADKWISFDNHSFLLWWSWYFPSLITLKVSRYLLISLSSCSLKNYSSASWHPSTSLLKPLSKWAFMDFILKHHILSQITAQRSPTVYNSIKYIRDFTKFFF